MKGIWNAPSKFRIKVKNFLLLFGINKNNVGKGGLKAGVVSSGNQGRGLLPGDSRGVDPRNIINSFYLSQPRHKKIQYLNVGHQHQNAGFINLTG